MEFQFFDPGKEVDVIWRKLPHWEQRDAYYFLTWRTADSIPASALEQWHNERTRWLATHGILPKGGLAPGDREAAGSGASGVLPVVHPAMA